MDYHIISPSFIKDWQTLIGSFLGPFLAVLISMATFLAKQRYDKRQERKEAIRRVEIGISQSLTHIFIAISQLKDFVIRSKIVIGQIKAVTNPNEYALHETNFPAVINIFFDNELPRMKFRSYYLHNKILIAEYIIRWANSNIEQFKEDFEKLLSKNELLVGVKVPPERQREGYAENFEGFIQMIEKFLTSLETHNVRSLAEAKVYNLKLMERHLRTRWRYERIDFKYFRSKKEIKKYRESLDMLDRINPLIKDEVTALMNEVKNRAVREESQQQLS